MRLLIVRHGHPDYVHDCLTDVGKLQALAVAQRLKDEGIAEFHSSNEGRAIETAMPTAELYGKKDEIEQHFFIREASWERHPWNYSNQALANGIDPDWPDFQHLISDNIINKSYVRITEGLDEWLETKGYKRDGSRYYCLRENNDTIAIFGHAGSTAIMLSYLFNLPLMAVFGSMAVNFTAVTEIHFPKPNEEGFLAPKLVLFNDAKHIKGISAENIISNVEEAKKTANK